MMDLDELKTKWAEQDRKIGESLRLNRLLLSEVRLNRSQSALRRAAWLTGLHAALWVVCLVALGNFGYGEIAEPRFVIAAAALGVYAIGMLNCLIRQVAMAGQIDYGEPVAAIQRKVEALRILRIRTTQWGVLIGLVAWVPFAIVVMKWLWDVDAYAVPGGVWLAANVAFGLAMIPLAVWVSKKYGDRMERSSAGRRILRDLAGDNLNAAAAFLGTLAEFEG
jgi:hypothetical protein